MLYLLQHFGAQDPHCAKYCADRTKSALALRTAHPTFHLPWPQETNIVNVDAFNTSAMHADHRDNDIG